MCQIVYIHALRQCRSRLIPSEDLHIVARFHLELLRFRESRCYAPSFILDNCCFENIGYGTDGLACI